MISNYEVITTQDGSQTLRCPDTQENFHSYSAGALTESRFKFLYPIRPYLSLFQSIYVMDFGLGLGYNALVFLEERSHRCYLHSFDISLKPLEFFLQYAGHSWCQSIWIDRLVTLSQTKYVSWLEGEWILHLGDALETVPQTETLFNIILYDPFSPRKAPLFWSESFLRMITQKASPQSVFITYSHSASLRRTLYSLGWMVYAVRPVGHHRTSTIAFRGLIPREEENEHILPLNSTEKQALFASYGRPIR